MENWEIKKHYSLAAGARANKAESRSRSNDRTCLRFSASW
jgi:hypothetical protein